MVVLRYSRYRTADRLRTKYPGVAGSARGVLGSGTMTTLEQIEMVEAWAWLHAGGGLPEWDQGFGNGHRKMELLYFRYLRNKWHHVGEQWYKYALWAAETYAGRVEGDLVEYSKNEVRKKFTRTPTDKNPLTPRQVDDVIRNLPPAVPPFNGARRLTRTLESLMQDDWSMAAGWKIDGFPLGTISIRHFRPDLSNYMVNKKITEAEEQIHE